MGWRVKLYPSSAECFAAHPDGVPIGHGWREADRVVYLSTPGGFCNLSAHSVTGDGDQITVEPSILVSSPQDGAMVPRYHGWLRAGVLSDDCDGRTFPQFPGTA